LFDRYDSANADDWHRHMTLAMLSSAWAADESDPRESVPGRNGSLVDGRTAVPSSVVRETRLRGSSPVRTRLSVLGVLGLLVAVSALVGIDTLVWIARSLPALGQRELIKISAFYHPPEDGTSINSLVNRTGQVIFTRGDERYLQRMRELGFSGPAFQYLVGNETSGPERATSASAACSEYLQTGNDVAGIAGDFCSALHRDERNFVHNGKGERLYSELTYQDGNTKRTRYYYLMNPGSPAWREYFAQKASENAAALPYNGLFLDNIDLTPRRATGIEKNSDGKVAEFPGDTVYRQAVVGYLETLRFRLPNTPIWAKRSLTSSDRISPTWTE
jgi:hypothetical protein